MSPVKLRRDVSRDGFAVVAVLWIVGALAALAGIYAAYIINTTRAFAANDIRIKTDAAISASLALTAYELSTPRGQPTPSRGRFSFRLGRAQVAVRFVNEAARIDLNAASPALLASLFTALGASTDRAKNYADRLVAWRTPPKSAATDKEASLYHAAGLTYDPRQAPFASVSELWLVRGLPLQLVARALPYVTVFSGQAGIDLGNADPIVIAALPGMTPDRVAAVLRQRQSNPDDRKALIALLGPLQADVATTKVPATRAVVRIHFDSGRDVRSETVIRANGAASTTPYHVLSWRDDLDGPLQDDREDVAIR